MPKGYAKIGTNKGWFKKGIIPWNKNKKMTNEYREQCKKSSLGRKPSKESLIKKSKSMKKLYFLGKYTGGFKKGIALRKGIKSSKESIRKLSDTRKKLFKEGKIKIWNKGKKNIYNEEQLNKLRIARQKQIIKNNHGINMGKNEKRILDELELSLKYKIIRQYPIYGYFIDGYIPELNLIIEVDEKYHEKQKEKDKIKQKNIQNKLNCGFIRIKDY